MKKISLLWLVVGCIILSSTACRKPTLIGDELIPESDYLNAERQDTFSIITKTFVEDSIATNFNLFFCLGNLDQIDFGKSSANIYATPKLPTNNLNFGALPVIDSVVLILDYSGYYGDTTALHSVSVYRLIEPISTTQFYFSDSKILSLATPIGEKKNFTANLNDSIDVFGFTYEPHLRIKLSDWFANELDITDTAKFENDTTFSQFLNGFLIQTDETASDVTDGGVMICNLSASISGMVVYYSNATADSLVVTFPFAGSKFSEYSHQYDVSNTVYPYLSSTLPSDDRIFVQGFAGLRSYIEIPNLDSLKGVSINKAEIIFTIDESATGELDTVYAAPPALLLVRTDSTKTPVFDFVSPTLEQYYSIDDQSTSDMLSYGGRLDTLTNRFGQEVHVYRYEVTRHFQNILQNNRVNDGFVLSVYPGNRIPHGVILGGSGNADEGLRPYLSITYTTINK